jgi:hypothetical protein
MVRIGRFPVVAGGVASYWHRVMPLLEEATHKVIAVDARQRRAGGSFGLRRSRRSSRISIVMARSRSKKVEVRASLHQSIAQ